MNESGSDQIDLILFFASQFLEPMLSMEMDGARGTEYVTVRGSVVKPKGKVVPKPFDDFATLYPYAAYLKPTASEVAAVGQGRWYDPQTGDAGTEVVKRGLSTGAQGTPIELVLDINPGSASSNPSWFTAADGRSFFTAEDGTHGRELWVTQADAATTHLVKDIEPGANGSNPSRLTAWGARLLFSATSANNSNREPWISDGTAAGTYQLKEIGPGTTGSFPSGFLPVGNRAWFAADDGTAGMELWVTDGTAAGTALFRDLNPGTAGSFPSDLVPWKSGFLFTADNGSTGLELFYCDGTASGIVLVADIRKGAPGSFPEGLKRFGSGYLFTADDGSAGLEPWFTDGTTAGTRLVKDIRPGAKGSRTWAFQFVPVGSRFAWFAADDGSHGEELWITDGTVGGTRMVTDINKGVASSNPYDLFYDQGQLYFGATEQATGTELWVVPTGAVAVSSGPGCGQAALTASDPVLGQTLSIRGVADARATGGAIYLGAPAAGLIPFGPRCFLSLTTPLVPLFSFAGGGGYATSVPIPNDPTLLNQRVVLQALHFVPTSPGGFDTTNGVDLYAGR